MAIVAEFNTNATPKQYDEVTRRLNRSPNYPPRGLLYHVCCLDGGTVKVIDVLESPRVLDALMPTLKPILDELGIDPGEPHVSEVHNIIEGSPR